MACKPEDILNIAIELGESSNEAKIRTSIGRSYYAVYHSCLLDLGIDDTSSWVGGSGGTHKKLSQKYFHSGNNAAKGISFILDNMKFKRHIADYELNSNKLSRTDAEASINSAKRLLEKHGHLSPED